VKFVIDPSERVIIIGKTGSGKTEWAKYHLRIVAQHMPVVIIDPKEFWLGKHPQWEMERRKPGSVDKPHLINAFNPKYNVQILQPDEDSADHRLEKLCYDTIDRLTDGEFQCMMLYFDETEDIATAYSIPRYIRRVWKTGRALGLGAWVSTQVPTGIPRIFKSQAEKFITFQVGDEDVGLVASIMHTTSEAVASLGQYEYLYYDNKSMQNAVWMPPVPFKEK
jgi:energy-coupling factor transporter ATP-binding protein EcfA2